MNRMVCVLATLGVFGAAAQAQTSVTLYGVADINIEYLSNLSTQVPSAANGFRAGPGNNVSRLTSGGQSGSRWGLRGVEDLGGGLSALFVLESGLALDTGAMAANSRLFSRQAFVGLESARIGKFTFGRQYTTLTDMLANFSPTAFATEYDPIYLQLGLNYRSDNTAKYTGVFGPVTAVAHWTFGNGLNGNGEVPGQFRRDTGYGVGLSYAAGPYAASLGYDQYNPTLDAAGSTGSVKKAAVAASYTLGATRFMGGYRWGQSRAANGTTAQRDDYYWAGASTRVLPALELSLAYSYDNAKNVAGTNVANPWQLAFMAQYALSKRTNLYLTTAYAKHAGVNLDSLADGFGAGHVLGAGKDSMVGAGVGIRHVF